MGSGIGRRQGIETDRLAVLGQLTGSFGQLNGTGGICRGAPFPRDQQPSQFLARTGGVGRKLHGLLVVLNSFSKSFLIPERVAQIGLGIGERGPQSHGLPEVLDGLIEFSG